jgi:hypothetical protein
VERLRKRRLRFPDEPYLAVQLDLERLQCDLRTLAAWTRSPLPKRMRRQLGAMARQIAQLRRELREHPDTVEGERLRDDRGQPQGDRILIPSIDVN